MAWQRLLQVFYSYWEIEFFFKKACSNWLTPPSAEFSVVFMDKTNSKVQQNDFLHVSLLG